MFPSYSKNSFGSTIARKIPEKLKFSFFLMSAKIYTKQVVLYMDFWQTFIWSFPSKFTAFWHTQIQRFIFEMICKNIVLFKCTEWNVKIKMTNSYRMWFFNIFIAFYYYWRSDKISSDWTFQQLWVWWKSSFTAGKDSPLKF